VSDDQKHWQCDVCADLYCQMAKGNNFLDKIISIIQDNPEIKDQSMNCTIHLHHWDHKQHTSCAKVKTMLFFHYKDTVHFEFLEQGQRVKEHCYVEYWQDCARLFISKEISFGLTPSSCSITLQLVVLCWMNRSFGLKINNRIWCSITFTRFWLRVT
jgi:hypothetical protein